MKICLVLLALASLFCGVLSSTSVEVLYTPDSIQLQKTEDLLKSSDYSKFVSLCLGYSTESPSNWNGFYGYRNFANIPKSIVTLYAPFSLSTISTQTFPVDEDSNIENQYAKISQSLFFHDGNSIAEKVNLYEKNNAVISLEEQFLQLNQNLDKFQTLKNKGLLPEHLFIWYNFMSKKNSDSLPQEQIVSNVSKVIERVKSLVGKDILVISIFDEDLKMGERKVRETAKATQKEDAKAQLDNLAYEYNVNFHTAFTTIGFTTILFVLVAFVIAVGMWNIDPGRDSIIYRLTSQKIKKDQ